MTPTRTSIVAEWICSWQMDQLRFQETREGPHGPPLLGWMITAPSPKPASKIIKAGMSSNTRPPKTHEDYFWFLFFGIKHRSYTMFFFHSFPWFSNDSSPGIFLNGSGLQSSETGLRSRHGGETGSWWNRTDRASLYSNADWETLGNLKIVWILVLYCLISVDFVGEYTICAPNNEKCCYLNQSVLMPLLGATCQAGQANLICNINLMLLSGNPACRKSSVFETQ